MSAQRNTKETIIKTAMMLFWRESFDAVSVDRICKQAGVQKGSFYHFFSSKEVLAAELVTWMGRECEEQLLKPIFTDDRPAMQKFIDYAHKSHELIERIKIEEGAEDYPGCPFGNLIAEMATKSELVRDALKVVMDCKMHYYQNAIMQGQQAGVITNRLPAAALATLIITHWQGSAVLCKAHNDCDQFLENLQNMLHLLQAS